MNNQEARFILSAYRPGGQDAADPEMKEALEQVRNDPTLDQWLINSMQHDAAIARGIASIPVPEGLRAQILAGGRVTVASAADARSTPWTSRQFWNQFRTTWAIAASIAFLGLAAGVWVNSARHSGSETEGSGPSLAVNSVTESAGGDGSQIQTVSLAGWQTAALSKIQEMLESRDKFDKNGHQFAQLQEWLAENHGATAPSLPQSLKELESIGCKTIQWHGRPVSIVCFNRANGAVVHLVVVDRAGLTDAPPLERPRVFQHGKWATASWSEGSRAVMMATEGTEADIRKLL